MTKQQSKRVYVSDYLIQALVELLDKKAFSDITITEICTRAGVSRMSFYREYASKDDLVIAYLQTRFDNFLQTQLAKPHLSSDAVWHEFFALPWREFQRFQDEKFIWILNRSHLNFSKTIFTRVFHWDLNIPENYYLFEHFSGGMITLLNSVIAHGTDPLAEATLIKIFEAVDQLRIKKSD